PGLLLLLLPQRRQTDTGHLNNLETHTGNITLGLALATETGEEDFVVLVHEVQATVVGDCGVLATIIFTSAGTASVATAIAFSASSVFHMGLPKRTESSNLLSVLDQLHPDALSDGRNSRTLITRHVLIDDSYISLHATYNLNSPPLFTMSSSRSSQHPSNRLPAPALFVGPPSHNASNVSLLSPDKPSRNPLTRQRSLLSPDSKRPPPPPAPTTTSAAYDGGEHLSQTSSNPSAPFMRRQKAQSAAADADASSRAEAIWAEMQNTLEEVELSATKGPGMTVFGSEHSRALEALRKAQIDLAQAWARSEAEDSSQASSSDKATAAGDDATDMLPVSGEGDAPVTGGSGLSGPFERSKLEGETEKDIELSRKRREANDRYFEKVNRGVLEVVNRLEEVAKAMKGVESESKEIWRDGDSGDAGSTTTAPSLT
ncbi:hypothetical protein DM02DRAFT_540078, partial [Periconia macrospinosa]